MRRYTRGAGCSLSTATGSKDRRIRVNAVSPGSVDTPGLGALLASTETGQQRWRAAAAHGKHEKRIGATDPNWKRSSSLSCLSSLRGSGTLFSA
jgi:NAD(P)-dependent dehydrogenase (short-subunit alcohol dehydrogenase family)